MKVVFVAHSFYGPYFAVGSHHLARHFARRGHTVWHLAPVPCFHLLKRAPDYKIRLKRFFQGVIELEPNLREAIIRPLLPWQVAQRLFKTDSSFLEISDAGWLVRAHPELRDVDVLIVDEPRLHGIDAYIRPASTYYRPTDLYAEMRDDKDIAVSETALLARCRGLIATSQPVLEHMRDLHGSIPHLALTNGVDDAFALPRDEPPELKPLRRPRAIYVGAIDKRLDIEAIRFLAGRFPLVDFVIIGLGVRVEEFRAVAGGNIHLLGPVPHAELSAYLQHADVGLLPMSPVPANNARSPMKIYEYGMAGLNVLASHTPELDRRAENFVHLYTTHEEAAQRLQALLSAPADRAAIRGQCAAQTWSQKAALLETFIQETRAVPGGVGAK